MLFLPQWIETNGLLTQFPHFLLLFSFFLITTLLSPSGLNHLHFRLFRTHKRCRRWCSIDIDGIPGNYGAISVTPRFRFGLWALEVSANYGVEWRRLWSLEASTSKACRSDHMAKEESSSLVWFCSPTWWALNLWPCFLICRDLNLAIQMEVQGVVPKWQSWQRDWFVDCWGRSSKFLCQLVQEMEVAGVVIELAEAVTCWSWSDLWLQRWLKPWFDEVSWLWLQWG